MAETHPAKLFSIPVKRFASSDLPHFQRQIKEHKQTLFKLHVDVDPSATFLNEFRQNIELEASRDWRGVGAELLKASSTLRKLHRSLKELEDVKARLEIDDQAEYEAMLLPVREKAQKCIQDFSECQQRMESALAAAASRTGCSETGADDSCSSPAAEEEQEHLRRQQLALMEQELMQRRQEQLLAYREIEEQTSDLHEIFSDLARTTHEQAASVDAIETNTEEVQANVSEGARQLALAARLSGGVAPVAGAVIGGLVAGPLGLLVGAKVGGLAAVSGGLLGYAGGRMVNTARRGSDAAVPAGPPPRSPSAPARLDGWTRPEPGAVCRLRAAVAAWLGRPRRVPERPVDAVLEDDVDEADEADEQLLRPQTDGRQPRPVGL